MDRGRPSSLLFATCHFLTACAASAPPPTPAPAPTAPAPTATAAPSAKPEEKPAEVPTTCETKTDKWCLPPEAFVKRLCRGVFPNVALAMFGKATPWTRVYLRVKSVEAWSASGGLPSSEKLVYEEELLVLTARKAATGGMTVSGASGSVDVLRWNGTCASLMEEEITTRMYGSPKHARVPWRSLDDAIQNAILSDAAILDAFNNRKRECNGATTVPDGNPKCEKVDAKLNDLVVSYVRSGGAIPAPAKVP